MMTNNELFLTRYIWPTATVDYEKSAKKILLVSLWLAINYSNKILTCFSWRIFEMVPFSSEL